MSTGLIAQRDSHINLCKSLIKLLCDPMAINRSGGQIDDLMTMPLLERIRRHDQLDQYGCPFRLFWTFEEGWSEHCHRLHLAIGGKSVSSCTSAKRWSKHVLSSCAFHRWFSKLVISNIHTAMGEAWHFFPAKRWLKHAILYIQAIFLRKWSTAQLHIGGRSMPSRTSSRGWSLHVSLYIRTEMVEACCSLKQQRSPLRLHSLSVNWLMFIAAVKHRI